MIAFNCLNCTKFCQLILRKIYTIIATRCQILRLKCTKFDFRWDSAGIKGAASRQGGATGRDGEREGKEMGRGEEGRWRKGRDGAGKRER